MGTRDNKEFKLAIRDIAEHSVNLDNPYGTYYSFNNERKKKKWHASFSDRVRCSEWARKLAGLPDDNLEISKIRNEYAQFLRIQVRNSFLHGPFKQPPPENDPLCPLAEWLGNMMAEQVRLNEK